MRSYLGTRHGRGIRNETPVPHTYRHAIGPHAAALVGGGGEAHLRAMGQVGDLYAIVGGLAEDVSQVDWHLYEKPRTPGGGEREEVFAHAAADLWARPNPFMPRQEFVECSMQHLDLTGEVWWVLHKPGRLPYPVEMWPVPKHRMEVVPHPEKFLVGYVYNGPGGEQVPLRLDEVVQIRRPDPADIYRGLGPVGTILPNLETERMASEWLRNFFTNSAQPGGIIEFPESLTDEQFDEFRARWEEQHRGVARAHRVAILEMGRWVDRKYSMKDMEFTGVGEANSKKIRRPYRYPDAMLGEITDVNRASAEAMRAVYGENLLKPRLNRFKGAWNAEILPMYGRTAEGLEWDYDSPVPADRESDNAERDSKVAAAEKLIGLGFEPAGVLEMLGLPPLRMATSPPALAPVPVPAAPGPPELEPVGARALPAASARRELALVCAPAWETAADPAANGHQPHTHNGHPPAHARGDGDGGAGDEDRGDAPDLGGVRAALESALGALETAWEPILAAQIDTIADQIESAVDADDVAALAGVGVPAELTGVDVLRRALGDMARTAADRAAREVADEGVHIDAPDVDEDLTDLGVPTIVDFGAELVEVARVVAELAASWLSASGAREALRLWSPGASGRDVRDKVKSFLEGLKGADRAAVFGGALHRATNLGRAAAFGVALKLRPTGRIFAYEWNDHNRCGPCKDFNGHEFETLAEARAVYDNGGYPDCLGRERCRGLYYVTWRERRGRRRRR